jgi:uncharacterized protein (TIGR01568 family)
MDAEGDGEEVDCKRESSAATTSLSFSGLLRQLNELEQSVVSWGRKSASKDYLSPPPPPPLPARSSAKQRAVHSGGGDSKEGHGNFSPPPQALRPFQFQTTQQHRKSKSMDKDKAARQVEVVHSKQPPPPPPPPPPSLSVPPEQLKVKSTDDKGCKKEAANVSPAPQAPNHRKARSCDAGTGPGPARLDGSVAVAVVKQSDDPLSDFRRSMVNMIVENRIATCDELRDLLRHFLALNAPHHHDAILRAFTEIWDEAFSAKTARGHREPVVATRTTTPPRPRPRAPTPPRRRHAPPPPAWR